MLKHKRDEVILILTFLLLVSNLCWLMSPKKVKERDNTGKNNLQIFLLAGQSNMAGRGGVTKEVSTEGTITKVWNGFVPQECKPNQKILRFNAALKWEEAHEPMNYGIDCLASCGLGPGMAFANEILKKDSEFGVIGLVPCARGGTPLSKWHRGSLPYDDLVKRAKSAEKDGGIIRGLLWYHGESDVKGGNGSKVYKTNLEKFIHDLRTDLNSPNLPILQVILPYPKEPFKGPYIEEVRATQLAINVPNVVKIDAKGLELGPDGIHLTTPAQVQLGHMFAHAFLSLKSFSSFFKFFPSNILF
ncbi:putative carbohydrate esterase At4g34215 [Nicotiana tabacum]|uniref:Carbohydrate esterase At4g34215 n=1 Tax=Nicotiana tabacum TaxID=4097 RepID=A0A1S3XGH9_TOBAC|nr:probable carbohydrate esterase At4g34215 isoform X2 [Nicotiana tomentosiformis]XP_016438934.1 PREDICTED: probable carbohydrate esterase At4g34215 isoform X2 [Nicotiana tabacum]